MLEARDPHDITPPAALAELAQACGVLAMEGHGNRTLGHASLRDPAGRGFWVKRTGISLSEVSSPADFVLVDFDGALLSGLPFRPREWPIHAGIYRARPDVNMVAHSHPFHAGILASTGAPIVALTREGSLLRRRVRRFETSESYISSPALGAALADALGHGAAVLMQNGGVAFCGGGIGECTMTGVMLEAACRAQLAVVAANRRPSQADLPRRDYQVNGILSEAEIGRRWGYYRRRLAAYSRRLGEVGPVRKALRQPMATRTTQRDVALAEMAVAHRVLAMEGHGANTIGAISLRDPGGEGYWTKIAGIGMDEVFSAAEMVLVGFDGTRIAGGTNISFNWPLRSAILQARPDVNAIVYSHAFDAAAVSATDRERLVIGDDGQELGADLPVVNDVSGPVRDVASAARVVARLGNASGLLIKNTGMIAVGESLAVATLRAIALNRAARAQLVASAAGLDWTDRAPVRRPRPPDADALEGFWRYYCRKLDRYEAARPLPGE